MKAEFVKNGYLLTAAVPAGKSNVDAGYNVEQLARYVTTSV